MSADLNSDRSSSQPDLMAALHESLDRPTWVVSLYKNGRPHAFQHTVTWIGKAKDREAADAAAMEAWPDCWVWSASGPFVDASERDRLRAENEALKAEVSITEYRVWFGHGAYMPTNDLNGIRAWAKTLNFEIVAVESRRVSPWADFSLASDEECRSDG